MSIETLPNRKTLRLSAAGRKNFSISLTRAEYSDKIICNILKKDVYFYDEGFKALGRTFQGSSCGLSDCEPRVDGQRRIYKAGRNGHFFALSVHKAYNEKD